MKIAFSLELLVAHDFLYANQNYLTCAFISFLRVASMREQIFKFSYTTKQ